MGGSKRKASKNNGKSMGGSEVEGRATYILKEKLKLLKVELKRSNKESFGELQKSIKELTLVEKISELDLKDEQEIILVDVERDCFAPTYMVKLVR